MDICQDYEANINNTHARLFPVIQPQVYPLMTTAKCLHALNILYEDKKWELKIWTTKPKEEKKENLL